MAEQWIDRLRTTVARIVEVQFPERSPEWRAAEVEKRVKLHTSAQPLIYDEQTGVSIPAEEMVDKLREIIEQKDERISELETQLAKRVNETHSKARTIWNRITGA